MNLLIKVGPKASHNLPPTFRFPLIKSAPKEQQPHTVAILLRGALQLPSHIADTGKAVSNWWDRVMASIKSLF